MAVHSSYLGSVKVSGAEGAAFKRKIANGRGTKAATESAKAGTPLVTAFAKRGVVTLPLKKPAKAK